MLAQCAVGGFAVSKVEAVSPQFLPAFAPPPRTAIQDSPKSNHSHRYARLACKSNVSPTYAKTGGYGVIQPPGETAPEVLISIQSRAATLLSTPLFPRHPLQRPAIIPKLSSFPASLTRKGGSTLALFPDRGTPQPVGLIGGARNRKNGEAAFAQRADLKGQRYIAERGEADGMSAGHFGECRHIEGGGAEEAKSVGQSGDWRSWESDGPARRVPSKACYVPFPSFTSSTSSTSFTSIASFTAFTSPTSYLLSSAPHPLQQPGHVRLHSFSNEVTR
jgi:hypothetical protein